jgi:hypothetical protein
MARPFLHVFSSARDIALSTGSDFTRRGCRSAWLPRLSPRALRHLRPPPNIPRHALVHVPEHRDGVVPLPLAGRIEVRLRRPVVQPKQRDRPARPVPGHVPEAPLLRTRPLAHVARRVEPLPVAFEAAIERRQPRHRDRVRIEVVERLRRDIPGHRLVRVQRIQVPDRRAHRAVHRLAAAWQRSFVARRVAVVVEQVALLGRAHHAHERARLPRRQRQLAAVVHVVVAVPIALLARADRAQAGHAGRRGRRDHARYSALPAIVRVGHEVGALHPARRQRPALWRRLPGVGLAGARGRLAAALRRRRLPTTALTAPGRSTARQRPAGRLVLVLAPAPAREREDPRSRRLTPGSP